MAGRNDCMYEFSHIFVRSCHHQHRQQQYTSTLNNRAVGNQCDTYGALPSVDTPPGKALKTCLDSELVVEEHALHDSVHLDNPNLGCADFTGIVLKLIVSPPVAHTKTSKLDTDHHSFQEVQEYSAFEASLRLLPALIVGVVLNLMTGYFIDRVSPFWLIVVSTVLTAGSPLLMALIKPAWPYWWGAFPAQVLAPLSGDIFFTVGLIIVSEVFPDRTQALAGAVFNTVAYFGWSFGINSMQVVSMLVTDATTYRDKSSPLALLQGYQATFWAMFAAMLVAAGGAVLGLRDVNRIGLKRE